MLPGRDLSLDSQYSSAFWSKMIILPWVNSQMILPVNSSDHPIGNEDKTWKGLIPSTVPQDHSGRSSALKPEFELPCSLVLCPRTCKTHPCSSCRQKNHSSRLQHSLAFTFCTLHWTPFPHVQTEMIIAVFRGYRQRVALRSPSPVDIPSRLCWSWSCRWGRRL